MPKSIHATTQYLVLFFENLLLNKNHDLRNRYLHVNYENAMARKNDVGVNVGVNLTPAEHKVLSIIQKNNNITTPEIAKQCEVSTRTIERTIKSLKEKKKTERIGSDKTGHWITK